MHLSWTGTTIANVMQLHFSKTLFSTKKKCQFSFHNKVKCKIEEACSLFHSVWMFVSPGTIASKDILSTRIYFAFQFRNEKTPISTKPFSTTNCPHPLPSSTSPMPHPHLHSKESTFSSWQHKHKKLFLLKPHLSNVLFIVHKQLPKKIILCFHNDESLVPGYQFIST